MLVPVVFWNYGGMSQVSLTGTVNSRCLSAMELSIPSLFDDLCFLGSDAQNFEDDAE
jgi:hypothetical protein